MLLGNGKGTTHLERPRRKWHDSVKRD